ncbi:MAG: hypothetical protein AMXMBFR56_53450 [Polyangiaceae bacterium]
MAARRWRTSIDQSRLAATSGSVFFGLGFAHNLHTVEQVIELLRSGSITGTIFIGVLINDSGAPGVKAYEGSDEIAARSKSRRSRTRRGQR